MVQGEAVSGPFTAGTQVWHQSRGPDRRAITGGAEFQSRPTGAVCSVQRAAQKGGPDVIFDKTGDRIGGERLEQVVTVKSGEKDRLFRLPALADYVSIRTVPMRIMTVLEDWESSGSQEVSD